MELKLPYINSVLICGRLVADPHPLVAKGDRPGASFTVACNRYMKGRPSIATYVDVVCWGDVASAVVTCCATGSPVFVAGCLAQHERKNGKSPARKVLQVNAVTVQFLAKKETDLPSAEAPHTAEETP